MVESSSCQQVPRASRLHPQAGSVRGRPRSGPAFRLHSTKPAIRYTFRALAIYERALGPEHHHTATIQAMLHTPDFRGGRLWAIR